MSNVNHTLGTSKIFVVGTVPRLCEIQELCMTSARTGGSRVAAAGPPSRSCHWGYKGLEEEEMTLLSTYVYHWEKLCFLEKFGSSIVLEKSCSTSLVRGALVPGNQRTQVGHSRGAVPCLQVRTVRTTCWGWLVVRLPVDHHGQNAYVGSIYDSRTLIFAQEFKKNITQKMVN